MKELHEEPLNNGADFNPVPSMFTICNAVCGLFAIFTAMTAVSVPLNALLLVCAAMVFDVLDGLSARLLDAHSIHGMHLDSLADAISFGAAPASFIYCIGTRSELPSLAVSLLAMFYMSCTLWRLAAYNTRMFSGGEKEGRAMFIGLPSPAAAGMVCSMAWLLPQCVCSEHVYFACFFVYTFIASLLMVSTVPYPHLRNLFERTPLVVSLVVSVVAVGWVVRYGMLAFVLLAHIYIFLAPVVAIGEKIVRHMLEGRHLHFIDN